jgi:hypothetical protein
VMVGPLVGCGMEVEGLARRGLSKGQNFSGSTFHWVCGFTCTKTH